MADISKENHAQCQERKENVFHVVRYFVANLEKTTNLQKGNSEFPRTFSENMMFGMHGQEERPQKCARQTAAVVQP